MDLTGAETRVLQAFEDLTERNEPTTIAKVAELIDRSRPTVFEVIQRLAARGFLRKGRRSYELTHEVCPMCGTRLDS